MRANMRRMFTQHAFVLAVLFSFIGLNVHVWPDMKTNWEVYSGIEYYSSALQFAVQPIYFGGFILAIVVAASFPASGCLIDDLRERLSLYEYVRLGRRRYLSIKAFSASVCGGSAAALGFILHTIICYSLFLPSNPAKYSSHVLPFEGTIYENLYGVWGGTPMILFVALTVFATGMVWALVSLACAVWIPDKVIAAAAPVMVYYLWLWGGLRETLGWFTLSPAVLFSDGLTTSILCYGLIQYAILGAVAFMIFSAGINRRVERG
jgi:hypothetical protein